MIVLVTILRGHLFHERAEERRLESVDDGAFVLGNIWSELAKRFVRNLFQSNFQCVLVSRGVVHVIDGDQHELIFGWLLSEQSFMLSVEDF